MDKNKKIIWFTGLSGSGKTTLARELYAALEQARFRVKIIDGDVIRKESHQHLGFTSEDIKENNRLVSELCLKMINDFDYLLVTLISPFKESRRYARQLLKEYYVEVYVKAPLEVVIERDVKGYYQKALAGEINNFVGIDKNILYEIPENPEIEVDTTQLNPAQSIQKIIDFLKS